MTNQSPTTRWSAQTLAQARALMPQIRRGLPRATYMREAARAVWVLVTAQPHTTMRELADALGWCSTASAHQAIHMLIDSGYVRRAPGKHGALVVDVPFVPLVVYRYENATKTQQNEQRL